MGLRITSTRSSGVNNLKILVYGKAGVGKTTLAATIGEPTLIVSAEAGLLSLSGHEIDVVDISVDDSGNTIPKEKRIDRLGEVYKFLLTDEARAKYKWIFVDSITEISQNMVEKLQVEFPERKDALVLYGENSKRMRSLIKSFRDLPYYSTVFTALLEDEKDENGRRVAGVSMVGKIADQIAGFLDIVCLMTLVKGESGEMERKLITEGTESFVAKDRSAKLSKVEEPNLSVLAKKIRASKTNIVEKKEGVKNVKS